jgi:predicted acetyltransferase
MQEPVWASGESNLFMEGERYYAVSMKSPDQQTERARFEGMHPQLVEPSTVYKDSFLAAHREHNELYKGARPVEDWYNDFEGYIRDSAERNRGSSELWCVDNGEYVGEVTIRHASSEDWNTDLFGNISYEVRPSARGRGYATEMLKLALERAKQEGLSRVVLTCQKDNIESRRVIEKNGGVLIEPSQIEDDCLRFAIELH